ncbi:TIGR01548 family HAD-type hydrolase [Umezakia ovalisporum]|uniref:TIGR01548 family HAD-type hydrolase n=1 Tax=Umezakia ovalisporum FSS-43 TaxID=2740520 RepID=A0ABT6K619_9CYAN|nr:TIGR01548 family HAD-type hydrolase [Umezakia ovalisporum]MDH6057535.1 TIGR01548 family HAD-type hydrolase [Umezakia ovalisporum FSS-43]MDH6070703.1 TIGR01548 family HAD-type hydrolase [Umezakia ovalisporum CobakiLakeA]MDH6082742.1 TIGR01548 family HAD-type hydrolase [Umezakia ovalisporum FSS-44]MDH6095615.1 TIGR01548 family HAD-type hydrolase [Umezakia ovalisporum CobakiLakeB]
MTGKFSETTIVVFDIDGVVRDVGNSYRRALADTVEHFTNTAYRPTPGDIDRLKSEGLWNNDWEASQELIYRYFESQGKSRQQLPLNYKAIVTFFQSRYRGTDPENWTGYICNEPLLLQTSYLEKLTELGICWGFFSGATRASATYVLHKRLGLQSPVLIAMEDAPGKPDPTGLFATVEQLENEPNNIPTIIYVGDTVADMYTVRKAREINPHRHWIGVGILPPHVQETPAHSDAYTQTLLAAGAAIVLSNVQQLNAMKIAELLEEINKNKQ